MSNISRKEFFAGCALSGIVRNPKSVMNFPAEKMADMAFLCASKLSEKFAEAEDKERRALVKIQDELKQKFLYYKYKLPDYLRIKKIKVNSMGVFNCINPKHEDLEDSCQLINTDDSNIKMFHCFGCGYNGDIFDAVELLEGITDHAEQVKFLDSIMEGENA